MASCGTAHGRTTRAKSAESIRKMAPCWSDCRCLKAPASVGSSPTAQTSFTAVAVVLEKSAPCVVPKKHERRRNDMSDVYAGGCACGAIRYEISGEPLFQNHCQCRDCQRKSG